MIKIISAILCMLLSVLIIMSPMSIRATIVLGFSSFAYGISLFISAFLSSKVDKKVYNRTFNGKVIESTLFDTTIDFDSIGTMKYSNIDFTIIPKEKDIIKVTIILEHINQ